MSHDKDDAQHDEGKISEIIGTVASIIHGLVATHHLCPCTRTLIATEVLAFMLAVDSLETRQSEAEASESARRLAAVLPGDVLGKRATIAVDRLGTRTRH